MFCTKCGKKLEDGDAFCGYCGKPISKKKNSTNSNSEPKIINVIEEENDRTFLPNENATTNHEEPKKDLVEFLMSEKPKVEEPKMEQPIFTENIIQMDEPKENLVDLVMEKPKARPSSMNGTSNIPRSMNDITLDEPKKEKTQLPPVVTIILGILAFIIAYFAIGFLFNNTNTKERNSREILTDISKYEQVQLGKLKASVPPYLVKNMEDPQYNIYLSKDGICSFSMMMTPATTFTNVEAMIDSSLEGSKNAVGGTMMPYIVKEKEINAVNWKFASTTISVKDMRIYSDMYAVLRGDTYYAVVMQNTDYDSTCNQYEYLIFQTLTFTE